MERTELVGAKVFDGVSKHKAALEAILVGCMLDESSLKCLEGIPNLVYVVSSCLCEKEYSQGMLSCVTTISFNILLKYSNVGDFGVSGIDHSRQ